MTTHRSTGWTPAPRQGLVPLYPYGFGTILGKSFAVLKGNPKVLLLFVVGVQTLAMTILVAAVTAITFAVFARAETVDPFSDEFDEIMAGSTAIVIIASIVMSLLLVAVTVIAQGVVVAEVAHASLAEKAPLGRLWRRVKPAFWRLVAYSLLVGLAVGIAAVAVAVPVALLAMSGSMAAIVGMVFGIIFVLLGGAVLYAWLGTKLFLVPSAIVLEGIGPFRAIARSWRLTRGRFWPTFGVVALLFLITQVAGSLISGVLSFFAPLIGGVLIPFGAGDSSGGAAIGIGITFTALTMILSFAIASIMTIVTGAGGTLAYIDARMRDEGIDLRMRRYVDQAGDAEDPYTVVPDAQPSPYAAPGYAAQGYPAQGYGAQGYPAQGYGAPTPPGQAAPTAAPGYTPGYAPAAPPYSAPAQDPHPPSGPPTPPAPPV